MDDKNFNIPKPPADLPVEGQGFGQDQQPSTASAVPELPKEPEDILESVEVAEESIKTPDQPAGGAPDSLLKPFDATVSSVPPPAGGVPPQSISKEPIMNRGKRAIILGVVIVVVAGTLAGAAWYGYGVFISSSDGPGPAMEVEQQKDPAPNQPAVNNDVSNNNDSDNDSEIDQDAVIIDTIPVPSQTDSDRDGLTDDDEELYGTNANKVDTDDDGLTDRDEVKVFKTDPNNPDTDGDSFLDGEEVRGGYDPKGEGRLLEIE